MAVGGSVTPSGCLILISLQTVFYVEMILYITVVFKSYLECFFVLFFLMKLLFVYYSAVHILNCGSLTKVLTEKNEEHRSWQPHHRTGSARSEGFYKISRKDKMRYLHNTRLAAELPSTSAQVLKEDRR